MRTIEIYEDRVEDEVCLAAHLEGAKADISQLPGALEIFGGRTTRYEAADCEATPEAIVSAVAERMLADAEGNAEYYGGIAERSRTATYADANEIIHLLYDQDSFEDAGKEDCKLYSGLAEECRDRAAKLRQILGM